MSPIRLTRREFMVGLGAAAVPAVSASAARLGQSGPLLPLKTPKVDHLDIIVPDVAQAARFYMAVFNTTLHAQPFDFVAEPAEQRREHGQRPEYSHRDHGDRCDSE